jgi:protein phosphatase
MPWSAKAQALLKEQYASTGLAGCRSLITAEDVIKEAIKTLDIKSSDTEQANSSIDLNHLLKKYTERKEALQLFTNVYRRYCWSINTIDDYRIAPFHILATEGKTWNAENHLLHMEYIAKYMTGDPIFIATDYIEIELLDEKSITRGIQWWYDLTDSGGEGMVIKPLDFIAKNNKELLQPAIKCRGREYLRIIYGPEYLLSGNLERLKNRFLGKKRSLALKEFALGMEALERFTRNEPLYRIHECVFGILALESEPVDSRL